MAAIGQVMGLEVRPSIGHAIEQHAADDQQQDESAPDHAKGQRRPGEQEDQRVREPEAGEVRDALIGSTVATRMLH